MTNKTKAIVEANKHLRDENRALWERNETLENGAAEQKTIYEAMIIQLLQLAGGTVTVPKTDVLALLDRMEITAEHGDDGSMTLTLKEREAGDD